MPKVFDANDVVPESRDRLVAADVFIRDSVLQEMIAHADRGLVEGKEIMGLMMGRFYRDADGTYAVVESTATSALDADEVSVRFDDSSLEDLFESMDRAEGCTVVGWYHSHPGFGCYLSGTDVKTHEGIFGGTGGYALVLDPVSGELAIFVTEKGEERKVRMVVLDEQ